MNSTQRFSDRVADYVHFRPGYPDAVIRTLSAEAGLSAAAAVADVGSGTGISTELFLKNGNSVYGVEPNAAMRGAAEELLRPYPRFHSVAGTAEATTLASGSVEFVVAGQAFHWFDPTHARQEFARILQPGGRVVLLWNDRRTNTTPFLRAYEALLLEHGTDYAEVNHRNLGEENIRAFFGGEMHCRVFPNQQVFDWEGLKGRLLSSSYTPAEGHPKHRPMLEELDRIFRAHQENGTVRFEYDTRMYFGRLEVRDAPR